VIYPNYKDKLQDEMITIQANKIAVIC